MTDEETIWLAGVFDSRGSAYFMDYTYTDKVRGPRQRVGLVVVMMTYQRPDLLRTIRQVFGSGYNAEIKRNEKESKFSRNKTRETFTLSHAAARRFLKTIQPFLRCQTDLVRDLLKRDETLIQQLVAQ
jgi:hypothetical protein